MTPADLPFLSLAALRSGLRAREFSPVEALDALESRIAAEDPAIHAYLSRDLDSARRAAEQADVSLPLGGIPIGVKDLIAARGEPCTCGSRILGEYRAPYDATSIARLRAAGAIPFGRLNMDEFAMGSSTENSAFGPTRNPWDLDRVPGGSSGGSAAAVAARTAWAALGTDTGGSIRQPAALCGVVGLKPTYGRVSRSGVTAFASSLDQVGPLARTVEDAALLLGAVAGHDPLDATSLPAPVPDYTKALRGGEGMRGLRLGRPREYFVEGIAPPVRRAVDAALAHCSALGAEIIDLSLPHTEHATAVYYLIATAEASANLARFDGVRYGRRADAPSLAAMYDRTRAEGFGPEVKRRILLGTHALSSGYHDAYYGRAQKVRTLIRRDFAAAWSQVDAIVCPVSPVSAFRLGERASDPLQMYLADVFTLAANLAGIPGLSVPCGFDAQTSPGHPLPVGLQFLGPSLGEETLLRAAHAYEQTTPWSAAMPGKV